MEIFVALDATAAQQERLREIAAGDSIHFAAQGAGQSDFDRCEVCFGSPDPAWLPASPTLSWLQLDSVGFGQYLALDWEKLGQRLTASNLAGFFNDPVAESTLAGILGLYRGIDRLALLQREGKWVGDGMRPSLRMLTGQRVLMFGRGGINRRLAELLEPFGCTLTTFGSDWTAEALEAALPEADLVVSMVPDMPATRGVFTRERLALLPEGAVFANAGRGTVVDEDALADALDSGALGGAVLDVTVEEPLPPDHRFWKCPNTLLTQHSGGGSTDEIDRQIEVFAANLARYREGGPVKAIIDFGRGY